MNSSRRTMAEEADDGPEFTVANMNLSRDTPPLTRTGKYLKDHEDRTAVIPGFVKARIAGEAFERLPTATKQFETESDLFYE